MTTGSFEQESGEHILAWPGRGKLKCYAKRSSRRFWDSRCRALYEGRRNAMWNKREFVTTFTNSRRKERSIKCKCPLHLTEDCGKAPLSFLGALENKSANISYFHSSSALGSLHLPSSRCDSMAISQFTLSPTLANRSHCEQWSPQNTSWMPPTTRCTPTKPQQVLFRHEPLKTFWRWFSWSGLFSRRAANTQSL